MPRLIYDNTFPRSNSWQTMTFCYPWSKSCEFLGILMPKIEGKKVKFTVLMHLLARLCLSYLETVPFKHVWMNYQMFEHDIMLCPSLVWNCWTLWKDVKLQVYVIMQLYAKELQAILRKHGNFYIYTYLILHKFSLEFLNNSWYWTENFSFKCFSLEQCLV